MLPEYSIRERLQARLERIQWLLVFSALGALNMCSDLFPHFAHFHYELGASSYYPPGSPEINEIRLFGMYHGTIPQHNKEVITQSLLDPCEVVRVLFATIALGMEWTCKE